MNIRKLSFGAAAFVIVFSFGFMNAMAAEIEARNGAGNISALAGQFELDGTHWTYKEGDWSIGGVLFKPEGDGPFPAIVISHGAGGSADGFATPKAREMVQWGFVCIGTSFTHAAGPNPAGSNPAGARGARGGGARSGGAAGNASRDETGGPVASNADQPTSRTAQQGARRGGGGMGSDVGASPENIRRAVACVKILESLPFVDSKRICAYGNSMGAFVTIALAAEIPDQIAVCAITAGGVREGGGMYPAPEQAEKIRAPFLILHGGSDTTVPPETSELLKTILDKNNVPNERRVYEGVPHPLHRQREGEVYQAMREWFEKYGILAAVATAAPETAAAPIASPASGSSPIRLTVDKQPGGLLFFATYRARDNVEAVNNPHILGALITFYWSQIEAEKGVYDWSELDGLIQPWIDAGKKVALRIGWSSNGAWPNPWSKHVTPQWVWDAGAVKAFSEGTKTEVPLQWDPIYKENAFRFLDEVARKFDGNPNLLFIDVSPGGETNPYRGSIDRPDPAFQDVFVNTPASDGRKYSDALWLETVKEYVDASSARIKKTQLGVTLNTGRVRGSVGNDETKEYFEEIGSYCVDHGLFVGQNGLNKNSYLEDSPRRRAFQGWQDKSRFYFEMVARTGGSTGTLMEVMQAAERIHCAFLGVYDSDVLEGTEGHPTYDSQWEEALAYGAKSLATF